MSIHMSQLPVKRICLDGQTLSEDGVYEFTIDCGAVYFGAFYNNDGQLQSIDQYFYSERFSRDDLTGAIMDEQLYTVDDHDFPARGYLLSKNMAGKEWLRFHAVVPCSISPDYFYNKYLS